MPPSNKVRSIAEVVAEAQAEDTAKFLGRPAPVNSPVHTGKLSDLDNEADRTLADLQQHLNKEEINKQREADLEADFLDSPHGKKLQALALAAERRAEKAEKLLEEKGMVLANGVPQKRMPKSQIDPSRMATALNKDGQLEFVNPYKNFPVREIDGKKVQLVASVPFYDKQCNWDDGYRSSSEHFIQSEHPNYANSVYVHIPTFKNFDKSIKEAFVIRTDEEVQLFYVV